MSREGFTSFLGAPALTTLVSFLLLGCADASAGYDFIWSGVSLQERQPDSRFTDEQVRTIAAHASYVFFSEAHGGWNYYNSMADARLLKASNSKLKVCLYWKPSSIVTRMMSRAQRDFLLKDAPPPSKEGAERGGGNPYVRETLIAAVERNGEDTREFIMRDSKGEPIHPPNNPHVYFLDVRNPEQRAWVVDAISNLLQSEDSPFDCVVLDSLNPIGGGNPLDNRGDSLCPDADPSFLNPKTLRVRRKHPNAALQSACSMRWFWQTALGLERYAEIIAAYNRDLPKIIEALRTGNPNKEIFFNGVSDKVWRVDRNVALLFPESGQGPHGAADEDFCIAYRRKRSPKEVSDYRDIEFYGVRAYKTEMEVREDWDLMRDAAERGKKLFMKTNLADWDDRGSYDLATAKGRPQLSTVREQRTFCHAEFLIGSQRLPQDSRVPAIYYKFGDRYRTPAELRYRDSAHPESEALSLLPAAAFAGLGLPKTPAYRALGGGLYCRPFVRGTVFLYFGDGEAGPMRFRHSGAPVDHARWSGDTDALHVLQPYGAAIFAPGRQVSNHGDCSATPESD